MSMSTACPLLSTEWTPPDRRPQEDIKVRRQAVQDNRRRPTSNAARERSRVKTLRSAFFNLQLSLPAVPPDTKLSKLDVLLLATAYITHLRNSLDAGQETGYHHQELREQRATAPRGEARLGETVCDRRVPDNTRHPVKKWPLRARLYQGILDSAHLTRARDNKHWKSSRPRVSQ